MRRPPSALRACLPHSSVCARHAATAAAPPPPGGGDGDGSMSSLFKKVEASYAEWAKAKGQCNAAGLLRGAKQAYMSLGVVIDASVKTPKQELKGVVSAILRRGRVEKSPVSDGLNQASSLSGNGDNQPISLATLPIGHQLKYSIALALKAGSGGRMNPYVVVDAWIHSFQHYGSTGATEGQHDTAAHQPNPSEFISDKRVRIIKLLPAITIPRNAQAYVFIGLLVVTPPRRFHAAYDWFYSRVQGHESENERVSLATVFASSGFGLVRELDHLVKLFAGIHVGFRNSNTLVRMRDLPEDMSSRVMGKRKLLGLYLSKEGEWTVAEVINLPEVFDFKPRGMVPPAE